MNKLKVSQKDMKLLIIMIALIILGATYQFAYVKNMDRLEVLQEENGLQVDKLINLRAKESKRIEIEEENIALRQEINQKVETYGTGATNEKSIMFIRSLEEETDMIISSVSFREPAYFLSLSVGIVASTETSTETSTENSTESNTEISTESNTEISTESNTEISTESNIGINIESKGENSVDNNAINDMTFHNINAMNGYQSTVLLSFRVSYEGLKESIDYINDYYEKSNIDEITIAYDSETGNIAGTLAISTYHLLSENRPYSDPIIGGIDLGNDNIFGTIELPMIQEENDEVSEE